MVMRWLGAVGVSMWLSACGARSGLVLDVDSDAALARDATFERDASLERDAAIDRDGAIDVDAALNRDAAVEHDAAFAVDAAVAPDSPLDLKSGGWHTCVVIADKSVRCWGRNYDGQLGDNSLETRSSGVAVIDVSDVAQLGLGDQHSCARMANGTIACWGAAGFGQRGNGTLNEGPAATRVDGIDDAIDLCAGSSLTCVRRSAGAVACWGPYTPGFDYRPQPIAMDVPALFGAIELAIGHDHGCARWSDGGVRCWGAVYEGQLGDGRVGDPSIEPNPIAVAGVVGALEVGAGAGFSCARLSNGTVKCWGTNWVGQIGDGTDRNNRLSPTLVEGVTNAVDLAVGQRHACVRLADGTVRCWGGNGSGEAGTSDAQDWNVRPRPVPGLSGAVALAMGDVHSCAQLRDGSVRCWGNDEGGQLGNGDDSGQGPVPVTAVW